MRTLGCIYNISNNGPERTCTTIAVKSGLVLKINHTLLFVATVNSVKEVVKESFPYTLLLVLLTHMNVQFGSVMKNAPTWTVLVNYAVAYNLFLSTRCEADNTRAVPAQFAIGFPFHSNYQGEKLAL